MRYGDRGSVARFVIKVLVGEICGSCYESFYVQRTRLAEFW